MSDPKTKADLWQLVQETRQTFAQLWQSLTPAQMTERPTPGEWSVQDIVAHVCAWEEGMCRWLGMAVSGELTNWPPSTAEVDEMNATFTAVNAPKSLTEVTTWFARLESEMEQAITAVSPTDLFDPHRFPWANGSPLWYMVGANTFWHYPEHLAAIQSRGGTQLE